MDRFVVMSSAACMPASCWGRYRKIAVVELDGTTDYPKMISIRARGVKRVVRVWDRLFHGKTDACAFGVALSAAEAMAERLNEKHRKEILYRKF